MKAFVFTSAAIHIAAFFFVATFMEIKPSTMVSEPFYASVVSANRGSKRDSNVSPDIGTKNYMLYSKSEAVNTPQSNEVIREIKVADIHEAEPSQTQPQVENYYSPTDVELIALPTSNLDSSMFSDLFISGLPIKLRLYINSFGHVVSIDSHDVLEQDLLMAERLEDLLRQITFLPAKRNGASVDSYQDIEFSF